MNEFSAVNLKTQVYKRDFTDKNAETFFLHLIDTGISAAGITPLKFYRAGGDLYAYCSDKTLKKAANGGFINTGFTSNVVPLVVSVIHNGENKPLFIGDTAVINGQTVSGVPYGADCAVCYGRLFIADGNKVKFSEEFDFTDFTVGLSFGGFIKAGAESGNVLHFAEDGGKLYVVCERAVYALTPYGNQYDFTMEKVSTFSLDVAANSVFTLGNRTCFISGNALCVLCGGKVKKVGKEELFGFTVKPAGGHGGIYVLPLVSGGSEYVYAYDTVSEKEIFMEADGFSGSSGYAVKSADNKVYALKIKSGTETAAAEYSGEYDFGSCRKKAVSRVEAHIRGSATLVVRGEGAFRATLTEKCNGVSCFIHGRNFHIGFENASEDFKAYNIAVHYTIYGD